MSVLGEKLRSARTAAELTQKGLASAVNSSQAMISQLERGEKEPRLDLLRRLAEALGVSQAYLLGEAEQEVSREEELYLSQLRSLPPVAREKLRRFCDELADELPRD